MDEPDEFQRKIKWAQENKKAIVKRYLNEQEYLSSNTPSLIFMAGLPGAGKTEFAKRLLPQLENRILHIDMDEIATKIEGYSPRHANIFKGGASVILERLYDKAIEKRIDILMDGTFGHSKAITNVDRAVGKHSYNARVYYIHQSPLTAWQVTKKREAIEHRAIDPEKFCNTYYTLLNNLNMLQTKYGEKVPITVVVKREDNTFKEFVENVQNIKQFTSHALTLEELRAKICS